MVTGAPRARLDGFTITGGYANGEGERAHGGGIYNAAADVVVVNSMVVNNAAVVNGGGIVNYGSLEIEASTVANNTAGANGGGLGLFGEDRVVVRSSTFTRNSATES